MELGHWLVSGGCEKDISQNVNGEAEKTGLQKEKPKAATRKDLKQETMWPDSVRMRPKQSHPLSNISRPAQSFAMPHHTVFGFHEIALNHITLTINFPFSFKRVYISAPSKQRRPNLKTDAPYKCRHLGSNFPTYLKIH